MQCVGWFEDYTRKWVRGFCVPYCNLNIKNNPRSFYGQGFYEQIDQQDTSAMDYAKRTMTMNLMTEDAQEGIGAFMEKRDPVWKNR